MAVEFADLWVHVGIWKRARKSAALSPPIFSYAFCPVQVPNCSLSRETTSMPGTLLCFLALAIGAAESATDENIERAPLQLHEDQAGGRRELPGKMVRGQKGKGQKKNELIRGRI